MSRYKNFSHKAHYKEPLDSQKEAIHLWWVQYLFVLTLLPHHLFDSQDIQWLQSFKDHHLSDEEARTLIIIREKGSNTHEKPVYIKSKGLDEGAYRRIGSSDQICTREDLDLLYQLRSRRKYDETLVENASFADFEHQAIKQYRHERARIKPDASELNYNDEDLYSQASPESISAV